MLKCFRHAMHGIMLAVHTQRNVKIQMLAAVLMIGGGIYFSFTPVEWCLAVLAMGLVLGLEVMNTSIEELVNFVSPERREEARRIKDLAAGAVLVAAMAAALVGCILFYSKVA